MYKQFKAQAKGYMNQISSQMGQNFPLTGSTEIYFQYTMEYKTDHSFSLVKVH